MAMACSYLHRQGSLVPVSCQPATVMLPRPRCLSLSVVVIAVVRDDMARTMLSAIMTAIVIVMVITILILVVVMMIMQDDDPW